jgi:hypothetical protein
MHVGAMRIIRIWTKVEENKGIIMIHGLIYIGIIKN